MKRGEAINSGEFFSHYRGLIIAVLFLLFSIFISILLFTLFPGGVKNVTPRLYTGSPEERQEGIRALLPLDFEFEDYTRKFDTPEIYYKRPLLPTWGKEQVEKYWIPVEEVILDTIKRQNTEEIAQIFSNLE